MLLAEPTSRRQDDAPPLISGQDPETLAKRLTLAKSIAWKFARGEGRRVPADELVGEALYGLTYAQNRFNAALGVPFEKYAIMVICHRLRNLVARWRRREREVPMPRLPHAPEEEFQTVSRGGDDPTQPLDAEEVWARVKEALPHRQYQLVWLHYQAGCSLAQIGRRLGVTRQCVSQQFRRAMDQLRQGWEE